MERIIARLLNDIRLKMRRKKPFSSDFGILEQDIGRLLASFLRHAIWRIMLIERGRKGCGNGDRDGAYKVAAGLDMAHPSCLLDSKVLRRDEGGTGSFMEATDGSFCLLFDPWEEQAIGSQRYGFWNFIPWCA